MNTNYDFAKYLALALVSLTTGMLFGFRQAGTYIFEIGNNFLLLGIIVVIAGFFGFLITKKGIKIQEEK